MSEKLSEQEKSFRYFLPPGQQPGHSSRRPERLRAAMITSIRDLITEGVGKRRETRFGEDMYVKGTMEYAIQQSVLGKLSHFLEIVLIITDDTKRDLEKLGNPMPLIPQREAPWIHPLDMRTRDGELVTNITRNIPSNFRALPLKNMEERMLEKRKFEDTVRGVMERYDAEVLISDHFLCRVEYLIDERYCDLRNKVLNTHPGISDRNHRFRTPGATPYQDAIGNAKGLNGPVHNRTGASFHIMEKIIDAGPVMVDVERTPVAADDSWEDVCARNYVLSKNPAFAEGIIHYAEHIYPHLNTLDLQTLQPIRSAHPIYGHAV